MESRRCLILGGARIGDYEAMKALCRPDDYVIACDAGLSHLEKLGLVPDLVVGDFDSHPDPHLAVETIRLPHMKDDTDTVWAAREALARGFRDFLLLGVLGDRLDHTLGNLSLLLYLDSQGAKALAADDHSDVSVVSRETALIPDTYPYFSIAAAGGKASGITIRNALYGLTDAEMTADYAYGVSNEPLPGQTSEVSVKEGRLFLIRDRRG